MTLRNSIRRGLLPLLLAALTLAAPAAHAATITIVNNDGVDEGFNDPTPVAPVGGNPGTTLGQQRLNVFQHAANIWGAILPSDVTILVRSAFNPLTCNATSAVLGSAGPTTVHSDFANAEFPNTWYHQALANRLAGTDLSVANPDINAQFNSALDGGTTCLGGRHWYYGLDGNEGTDVELLPVVLHEMGHGLGFSTTTSGSNGSLLNAKAHVYDRFLMDNVSNLHWYEMTSQQRVASAVNTGHLVWDGAAGFDAAAGYLANRPRVLVNSPASIAGEYQMSEAEFGGPITGTGVTGNVVLGDDGSGASTTDGCEPLVNAAQVAGNIVLLDRGTCTFVIKAQMAQAAGAIALIVANNTTGLISMSGSEPGIVIPVVMITQADGNLIKAALATDPVNVTINRHATLLSGADDSGRPLMYAPNPFEGGSSVSHWDVTLTPNALMEPAITTSISSSVDITTGLYEDIGWFFGMLAAPEIAPSQRVAFVGGPRPNPASGPAMVAFDLPRPEYVRLAVYDVRGARVSTIREGVMAPGRHAATWDGLDAAGDPAAPGLYLVVLTTSEGRLAKRLTLMR